MSDVCMLVQIIGCIQELNLCCSETRNTSAVDLFRTTFINNTVSKI